MLGTLGTFYRPDTPQIHRSVSSVPVGGGGLVQSLQRGGVAVGDAGAGARHPPPPEPVRAGHPGVHRGNPAAHAVT